MVIRHSHVGTADLDFHLSLHLLDGETADYYTLDLLPPVVGLGQKSAWQPGNPALQDWAWALTFSGWVLSAAIVAGLTGILKRD